ncbi:MAG: ComEC/Rec2 family competence protein [Flavobacteriales bacterium]
MLVMLMVCFVIGHVLPKPSFLPSGIFPIFLFIGIISSLLFLTLEWYYALLVCGGICLYALATLQKDTIPILPKRQGYALRLGNLAYKNNAQVSSTAEWYDIQNNSLIPTGILVNCRLHSASTLTNGTLIFTTVAPTRIESNTNPGAFDAALFYQTRHIFYSAYLGADFLAIGQKKGWLDRIADVRKKLSDGLAKNLNGEAIPLAQALLLGDASNISPAIKKDFSVTGAIHVLAVSGMHIALFAQLLLFSFSFLSPWISKTNALIIAMLVLWLYAFLTGLSPSVLRSVIMFSLVQIGVFIGRKSSDNHVLLCCAMIMIAFDGNCLYDLGFQLSFLAVFGILNYQKTITRLLKPSHRLTVFFWEATAVAIAAQLFTLPIILYTFHTFPNYFLVANLLVVVVSALAMYVGFIYLFLTFIPTIGEWVGELFNAILYALHQGLHGIANFPGSVENGFQFSLALLFFLLLSILFMLHGHRFRGFRFVPISLVCLNLVFQRMENVTSSHVMLLKSDVPITLIKQKSHAIVIFPTGEDTLKQLTRMRNVLDDYQKVFPVQRVTYVALSTGETIAIESLTFKREFRNIHLRTPMEHYQIAFDYNKPWTIMRGKKQHVLPFKGGILL